MNIITDAAGNNRKESALTKRQAVALQVAREEVLKLASSAFHRHCIPFFLWKGMDFAYSLYENPDERPMGDIDLLVPMNDAERAWTALANTGFSTAEEQKQLFTYGITGEAKFVLGGVLLELHTHPLYYPSLLPGTVPLPGILRETRTVCGYAAPCWTDTLLYTALHHADSSFLKNYQKTDIRLLAEKMDEKSWRWFGTHAAASGWGNSILKVLVCCGAEIPLHLSDTLQTGNRKGPCGTLGAIMKLRGKKRRVLAWSMFRKVITGMRFQGRN